MKVLLVHNFYQSALVGGEDIVFQREKESLEQHLGKQNVFCYTLSNDDIKLWRLPFQIWYNRRACQDIQAMIKQHSIDLVHVHNFFPQLTPQIFVAAKQAGAKVVHTLHNYRWWCLAGTLYYKNKICKQCVRKRLMLPGMLRGCYRGSKLQSLLAGLAFAWYKRKKVIEAIDGWLVLSEHQREQVAQWLPFHKIYLKPNAVQPQPQNASRHGYVFVGRLEHGKGIELLCDTWEQLDGRYELTVIGDGPLKSKLQSKYAHLPIQFLGSQSLAKTQLALASARFCIQPSLYYETFGLVMIEAMAQGTPVIGLNVGTRAEMIQHQVNGLVTSAENLAQTIMESSYCDYDKLSAQAQKTARQFSQSTVLHQQINLYHHMLSAS